MNESGKATIRRLILCGLACTTPTAMGAPDVDAVESSIVRVVIGGHGTGWVVSPGVVATNWHVAEGTRTYEIIPAGSNQVYTGRLRWIGNSSLDIALIDVPGLPLEPFTIYTGDASRGSPSYTIGFPGLGDDLTGRANSSVSVYGGTVALIVENTSGVKIIQHTNIVNAGNSGGPLMDDCGRVLGLTTWGIENQQYQADFIWASVHVSELAEQMDRLGIPYENDSSPCTGPSGTTTVIDNSTTTIVDTTEALDTLNRQVKIWAGGLAAALMLTFALALRKPRQQIVYALEQASKVVKRSSGSSSFSAKQSTAVAGTSKARTGLAVSGSDAVGNTLRIELYEGLLKGTKGLSIGRAANLADFVLADDAVSRRHMRFSWKDGTYYIEDLNSSNGTMLNGKALQPYTPLAVSVGDTVRAGTSSFTISRL